MKRFTLDPEGFFELRKRMLYRSIPLLLLAMIAGSYIAEKTMSNQFGGSFDVLPFVLPISLIAVSIGLSRGIKIQRDNWESYELVFKNSSIIRVQNNVPRIEIKESEVSKIIEARNGDLNVNTTDKRKTILIPHNLINFEEVKSYLDKFGIIKSDEKQFTIAKWQILSGIISVVLFVLLYLTEIKIITYSSGAILIVGLLWSFIEIQRNKNINLKIKKIAYSIFLVIPSIIVRMLGL